MPATRSAAADVAPLPLRDVLRSLAMSYLELGEGNPDTRRVARRLLDHAAELERIEARLHHLRGPEHRELLALLTALTRPRL